MLELVVLEVAAVITTTCSEIEFDLISYLLWTLGRRLLLLLLL